MGDCCSRDRWKLTVVLLLLTCFFVLYHAEEPKRQKRTKRQSSNGGSTNEGSRNDTTVYCEIVSNEDEYMRSAERRLIDYLFGNRNDPKYISGVRPRRNSRLSVDVSVQLSLLSINSLDDKNQELSTTGYIMMEWTDEFLIWNPNDFDNLTNMVVQPELLWLPSDVGIENSVDAIYQSSFRTEFRAIVDYEGKVTWTPGGRISTSCKLDVTFYPYDFQSCIISLSSWAYSDKHVHLTTSADRIDLKDYNINGEWHIVETKARAGVRFYGEPYSYVMFEISIQRKFYYHLINILLPCTLMSGLILLVFKLPAESGEKTGLGITILLSFSVFLLMIAESLPKTSDSLPIIGFYLTFLLVASSSSLLLTVITLNMHHATGEKGVPLYVRRVLKVLSVMTFTRYPKFRLTARQHKAVANLVERQSAVFNKRPTNFLNTLYHHSTQSTEILMNAVNNDADNDTPAGHKRSASQVRSPYLLNYTMSSPQCSTLPLGSGKESKRRLLQDALLASQINNTFNQGAPPPPLPQRTADLQKMRESLAVYIEELSWKMRKAELEDEVKKDWKECGLCVDRIAFRVFSLIVGSVSATMCIGLPVVRELTVNNHW